MQIWAMCIGAVLCRRVLSAQFFEQGFVWFDMILGGFLPENLA